MKKKKWLWIVIPVVLAFAGLAGGIFLLLRPVYTDNVAFSTAYAFGENYREFLDGFAALQTDKGLHGQVETRFPEKHYPAHPILKVDFYRRGEDSLNTLRLTTDSNNAELTWGIGNGDTLYSIVEPGFTWRNSYIIPSSGSAEALQHSAFNPANNPDSPLSQADYDAWYQELLKQEAAIGQEDDSEAEERLYAELDELTAKLRGEVQTRTYSIWPAKNPSGSFLTRLAPEQHSEMQLNAADVYRMLDIVKETVSDPSSAIRESFLGSLLDGGLNLGGSLLSGESAAGETVNSSGEAADLLQKLIDSGATELYEEILDAIGSSGLSCTLDFGTHRGLLTSVQGEIVLSPVPSSALAEEGVTEQRTYTFSVSASLSYQRGRLSRAVVDLRAESSSPEDEGYSCTLTYTADKKGKKHISTVEIRTEIQNAAGSSAAGSSAPVRSSAAKDKEEPRKLTFEYGEGEFLVTTAHTEWSGTYLFTRKGKEITAFSSAVATFRETEDLKIYDVSTRDIKEVTSSARADNVLQILVEKREEIAPVDNIVNLFTLPKNKVNTKFGNGENGFRYRLMNYAVTELTPRDDGTVYSADGYLVEPADKVLTCMSLLQSRYVNALQQIYAEFGGIDYAACGVYYEDPEDGLTYVLEYDPYTDSLRGDVYVEAPEDLAEYYHPVKIELGQMSIHRYQSSEAIKSCAEPSYYEITCEDCGFLGYVFAGTSPELSHQMTSADLPYYNPETGKEATYRLQYCSSCGGEARIEIDKYTMKFTAEEDGIALTGFQVGTDFPLYCLTVPAYLDQEQARRVKVTGPNLQMNQVTVVYLSEGIEEVGEQAFSNGRAVMYYILPKTLKKIGWNAFPDYAVLYYCGTKEEFAAIEGASAFTDRYDITVIYDWDAKKPIDGLFDSQEESELRDTAIEAAYLATQTLKTGGQTANTATQKNIAAGDGIVKAVYDKKTGLLVLQRNDGVIRILNPENDSTVWEISAGAGCMDADNGYIATGILKNNGGNTVGEVTVYEIATGKIFRQYSLPSEHGVRMTGVQVALDGNYLFYMYEDDYVPVYRTDLDTGKTDVVKTAGNYQLSVRYGVMTVNRDSHTLFLVNRNTSPVTSYLVNTLTGEWQEHRMDNGALSPNVLYYDGADYANLYYITASSGRTSWTLPRVMRMRGEQVLNEQEDLFVLQDRSNREKVYLTLLQGKDGVDAALITTLKNGKAEVATVVYRGEKSAVLTNYADRAEYCGGDRVLLWTKGCPNACLLTLQ